MPWGQRSASTLAIATVGLISWSSWRWDISAAAFFAATLPPRRSSSTVRRRGSLWANTRSVVKMTRTITTLGCRDILIYNSRFCFWWFSTAVFIQYLMMVRDVQVPEQFFCHKQGKNVACPIATMEIWSSYRLCHSIVRWCHNNHVIDFFCVTRYQVVYLVPGTTTHACIKQNKPTGTRDRRARNNLHIAWYLVPVPDKEILPGTGIFICSYTYIYADLLESRYSNMNIYLKKYICICMSISFISRSSFYNKYIYVCVKVSSSQQK